MFTRPSKKRRGRQPPPWQLYICFWCGEKLLFNLATQRYYCRCGWKQ